MRAVHGGSLDRSKRARKPIRQRLSRQAALRSDRTVGTRMSKPQVSDETTIKPMQDIRVYSSLPRKMRKNPNSRQSRVTDSTTSSALEYRYVLRRALGITGYLC